MKKKLMGLVLLAMVAASAVFAQQEPDFSGTYHIVSKIGSALSIDERNNNSGGPVVIIKAYSANANHTQWVIERQTDGTYIIINAQSKRVIDVPNSSQDSGAKLIQYNRHGQANQRWRIARDKDGYVMFTSVVSEKVIDIPNSTTVDNTQVIQYNSNGRNNQKFKLEPVGSRAGTPTNSLDGVWDFGGFQITISGSTGTYSRMDSSASSYVKNAMDKGFVKVGTQYFRNLKSAGASTWSGQELLFDYTGNVTNNTVWVDCTITLSADGQTLQSKTDHTSLTLTRAKQSASAVSALNGRWVRGNSEITFDNGNFQLPDSGSQFLRGTYTISGNNVTIKVNEAYGGHPTFQGMVESKWYTRNAMKTTKLGPHFTEEQLDAVYLTQTWTYSVSGNRLSLDGEVYNKR